MATIKEIRPSTEYDRKYRGSIFKAKFSGKVFVWDWNGDLIGGSFYENGKRLGSITPVKSNESARIADVVCTTYVDCQWSSVCYDHPAMQYPIIYGTTPFGIGSCSYPDYGHGDGMWGCAPWEQTGSYSYTQCYDSGESGGGEGTGPNNPNPQNPCEHSNLLTTNSTFKEKMNDLKSKVNNNYEAGYVSVNGDYVYVQGAPNSPGFDLQVDTKINGLMHSHYSGLLSIFSPDDLYSMVALYKADKMVDPKTFYMGLLPHLTSGRL